MSRGAAGHLALKSCLIRKQKKDHRLVVFLSGGEGALFLSDQKRHIPGTSPGVCCESSTWGFKGDKGNRPEMSSRRCLRSLYKMHQVGTGRFHACTDRVTGLLPMDCAQTSFLVPWHILLSDEDQDKRQKKSPQCCESIWLILFSIDIDYLCL